MKKVLSLFLSIVMLLSITAGLDLSAYAQSSDYWYDLLDDGTVEITGYKGSATNLTIPATLDGYTVTSIGEQAFSCNDELKKVTIPNGVTSIGDSAFFYCSSLTSVTMSSSVTGIGNSAFNNCSSLASVTIPNKVKSVGDFAFAFCNKLTSISIPSSVTSIGECSFSGCNSLSSIYVDTNNKNYSSADGVLFNKAKTDLIQYPVGNERISYTIPNSIKKIDARAFYFCKSLANVSMSDNVETIEEYAFAGCSAKNINLSKALKIIEHYAFNNSGLESITIPSSVEQIGYDAFSGSKLNNISFPSDTNIKMFGSRVFRDTPYYNDESNWENGTLYIGPYLINVDGDIVSGNYTVKNGTIGIAAFAFGGLELESCTNVTNIVFPNTLKYVSYGAFCECKKITKLSFPESVEVIWEGPFSDCTNLKEITINNPLCDMFSRSIDGGWALFATNLTIRGYAGSTAEAYCKRNGNCNFVIIGKYTCNHELKYYYTEDATCTSKGYKVYECKWCRFLFNDNYVNAKGHNYKTVVSKKGTTSANGSYYKKCSRCGTKTSSTTIYKASSIKLSATSYTFNGKVKKPTVTVKDSNGKALKNGTDYTVAYQSGRKNVGKYSVKITFKGNYSGSKTLYFTIKPKATSISKLNKKKKGFTVKWKKLTTQTTGYEIQYATNSKFTKNKKTVTVSKSKTTSKTISKLKSNKKYYVRVRTYKTVKVNGKSTKIYSSWSKAKVVTTK